ncbi:MAG: hypothetical protein HQL12_05470 [Candidatus Omnitrophica bacterium]|nr:hypothetical protein [Candidatus Omnitrophota bacterium]
MPLIKGVPGLSDRSHNLAFTIIELVIVISVLARMGSFLYYKIANGNTETANALAFAYVDDCIEMIMSKGTGPFNDWFFLQRALKGSKKEKEGIIKREFLRRTLSGEMNNIFRKEKIRMGMEIVGLSVAWAVYSGIGYAFNQWDPRARQMGLSTQEDRGAGMPQLSQTIEDLMEGPPWQAPQATEPELSGQTSPEHQPDADGRKMKEERQKTKAFSNALVGRVRTTLRIRTDIAGPDLDSFYDIVESLALPDGLLSEVIAPFSTPAEYFESLQRGNRLEDEDVIDGEDVFPSGGFPLNPIYTFKTGLLTKAWDDPANQRKIIDRINNVLADSLEAPAYMYPDYPGLYRLRLAGQGSVELRVYVKSYNQEGQRILVIIGVASSNEVHQNGKKRKLEDDVTGILEKFKPKAVYGTFDKLQASGLDLQKMQDAAMDALGTDELSFEGIHSPLNAMNKNVNMGNGESEIYKGGIDLSSAGMNLQTQNNAGGIKFHLDPAKLAQLQNAPGFVPVIINIQPVTDLRNFLGSADGKRGQ